MKKTYKLENLDCANCAAKMENAINNFDNVENCSINFMGQKMTLEVAEDQLDDVLENAQKAIKKVDRDCKIVK